MIGIYKITNKINGKCYIGQSIDIKKRIRNHKCSETNIHLANAFRMYGIENFTFEILEECKQEELNKKEIYYISLYKSSNQKYGYNVSHGGNGNEQKVSIKTRRLLSKQRKGRKLSETSRKKAVETYKKTIAKMPKEDFEKWHKKIGKKHKGKTVSQEQREKISKTLKEYFKDESNRKRLSEQRKGKPMSLSSRLKMSMAKQVQMKQYAKKVLQYDFNDNLIAEYESLQEVGRKTKINISNICACCNGKRKTCHGFKWKYDIEYNKKYRKEKNFYKK